MAFAVLAVACDAGDGGPPATASGSTPSERLQVPQRSDIYYLVFDRYADEDTLRRVYDFDNRDFLDRLADKGFQLPPDSTANYARTGHSLASSLNMRYLDYLARRTDGKGKRAIVYNELSESRVARYLKSRGYRYLHIGSWFPATAQDPLADVNYVYKSESGFRRKEWERREWQFATVARTRDKQGPKFIFAHFLVPHPPYTTDRDGRFVSRRQERRWSVERRYVEQLVYTNKRIRRLLNHLLAGPSRSDPVIIVQADEGPELKRQEHWGATFDWTTATKEELLQKFLLFNAYYLPGGVEVYPSITPVNTFRLVFNEYLGADFRLLPDRNYIFLDPQHPLQFRDVTERIGVIDG